MADLLTTPPPDIPPELALQEIRKHYGIDGELTALAGERDRNFRLLASDGREFVLKFTNAVETPDVSEFQIQALIHLEATDPDIPVPRVRRTLDGSTMFEVAALSGQRGRVYTYLTGVPAAETPTSRQLRLQMGQIIGALDRALTGFRHPGESYVLRWDMMRAPDLRPWLYAVRDESQREWIGDFLDEFERATMPALAALPHRAIHNDLTGSNILLRAPRTPTIAGIVDFGDMVRAPRINELGVAATYQLDGVHDPFEAVADMVEGCEAVAPLLEDEIALLSELLLARLVLRVVIPEWRAEQFPQNRDYILRHNAEARKLLDGFMALPRPEIRDRLISAIRSRRTL